MKIFLELYILGAAQTEVSGIVRQIEHDLSGTYHGHNVSVEQCEDPSEAYSRGYNTGLDNGAWTCEAGHS